jgi:hypothetical protein
MSKLLLPKMESSCVSQLLNLWAEIPLRSSSPRNFGRFFGEDSSALADVFPGNVQVYLDHEDLRV